jgi:hypothetical protein
MSMKRNKATIDYRMLPEGVTVTVLRAEESWVGSPFLSVERNGERIGYIDIGDGHVDPNLACRKEHQHLVKQLKLFEKKYRTKLRALGQDAPIKEKLHPFHKGMHVSEFSCTDHFSYVVKFEETGETHEFSMKPFLFRKECPASFQVLRDIKNFKKAENWGMTIRYEEYEIDFNCDDFYYDFKHPEEREQWDESPKKGQ